MSAPVITDVCFSSAPERDRSTGLLGFLSLVVDGQLRLDGMTLRRTRDGRLTLSYPEKRGRAGGVHPYIKPLNDDARQALEAQVFDALGLDPEARAR